MAIPTKYDGIEYRSRLEARWAAFMQNIGWDIVYEPFDGDGYIPDFLVQGESPLLIEVKPAATQKEYEAAVPKAEHGLAAHWNHDVLIVGAAPIWGRLDAENFLTAGLLGEYQCWFSDDNGGGFYHRSEWDELRSHDKYTEQPEGWAWGPAKWNSCGQCHRIVVRHEEQGWHGRPCDHGDGDRFIGYVRKPFLESLWADACNDVKWRGKPA